MVGVQVTLNYMIRHGLAKPAVLVMPDVNGSSRVSLQCLNQVRGPQDLTYLAVDAPQAISRILRVQPPGDGWGVAGYSEGGFCAANMALQNRYRYGFAASISGYFAPYLNKLANPPRLVDPFGGNRLLRAENTPVREVRALAPGAQMPQFWLGAGRGSSVDVANAEYFAQELQLHQANVPLDLTPGGGHTMGTWHGLVPPMLAWMTKGLAAAVANAKRIASLQAAVAHHHKAPTGKKKTSNGRPAGTTPRA